MSSTYMLAETKPTGQYTSQLLVLDVSSSRAKVMQGLAPSELIAFVIYILLAEEKHRALCVAATST